MKKSEIDVVVQRHIQAFKDAHSWKDKAVAVCYQQISENILSKISDNATENTDEKMLEVVNDINKHIKLFDKATFLL